METPKPEYISLTYYVRCDGTARKVVLALAAIAILAIIGMSIWYRAHHG